MLLIVALAGTIITSSCSLRPREELEPMDGIQSLTVQHEAAYIAAPGQVDQPIDDHRYLLQPGDQIEVYFPVVKDYNFSASIRPDGFITLPMFGDEAAEGYSPEELATNISLKYSQVLRDPHSVVNVIRTGPQYIYVFGEVKQPNRYDYNQGIDLLNAITAAGGPLRTASLEQVVVVHVSSDGAYQYKVYNLNDLLEKSSPQPVLLNPRDIVVVPTSSIADFSIWINQYVTTFLPPIDTFLRGRYYWYLADDLISK